jgi:hypothetical protein
MKNFKQINPELKTGDRIMLLHMDGEDMPSGTKGKVIRIMGTPKFTKDDLGFMYDMEWYGDEGNVISKLSMSPENDGWVYDKMYYMETPTDINESKYENLDDVMKSYKVVSSLPKTEMKIIQTYLELIRELGIVNMFESPMFVGASKSYLQDFIKIKSYERDFDEDLVEQILDMADEVRNIIISKSIQTVEERGQEPTINNIQREMKLLSQMCVKYFMKLF